MIEQNKAIVRTLVESVINGGDIARIAELVSADYLAHDPSNPGRMGGVEGAKRFIAMLHAGISNMRYTIEDMIAEGDRVVYRWLLRGTHTGNFMGIPPTGNAITMTGIDILRLANGKIVESWVNADAFGLLQQLGVLPPPSALSPLPAAAVPPASGPRESGVPTSATPASALPPTKRC